MVFLILTVLGGTGVFEESLSHRDFPSQTIEVGRTVTALKHLKLGWICNVFSDQAVGTEDCQ